MKEELEKLLKEYKISFSRSRNDISDNIYSEIINDLQSLIDKLNKHDVMQRSELFKKRCSNCGVDELFTKDDYCNCCGAKQVSFFK